MDISRAVLPIKYMNIRFSCIDSDGLLNPINVSTFQWHFTLAGTLDCILRFW
jgi:hypothetical protein